MNLEYIALLTLVLVLVLRWVTSRHTNHLRLTRTELGNEHSKLKGEHGRLFERRGQLESSLAALKDQRAEAEKRLEEIRGELEKQNQRNEELGA